VITVGFVGLGLGLVFAGLVISTRGAHDSTTTKDSGGSKVADAAAVAAMV
jgi:hypothetical protein